MSPSMVARRDEIHRRRIERLRELSVDFEELTAEASREALQRFAGMFLGAERARLFLVEVERARASHREVSFGRWLWEGTPPPPLKPRFGWLSDWLPGRSCVRLDRRVELPALRIGVATMLDEWAFSWPGAYASFETGRAMVVSLDHEVTCYDLAAPGKTPYR